MSMVIESIVTSRLDYIREESRRLQNQLRLENCTQEAWSRYYRNLKPIRKELNQYLIETMNIVFWSYDTRVMAKIDDPSLPGAYQLTLYVNKMEDEDRLNEIVNQIMENYSDEV